MKHLVVSQLGEKYCFVNVVDLHLSQRLEFPTANMMASPSARQVLIGIIANLLKKLEYFGLICSRSSNMRQRQET